MLNRSLIQLLQDTDPDALASIGRAFPGERHHLRSDRDMGDDESAPPTPAVQLALALSSVGPLGAELEKIRTPLQATLRTNKWLKFGLNVLSAISASTVITLLAMMHVPASGVTVASTEVQAPPQGVKAPGTDGKTAGKDLATLVSALLSAIGSIGSLLVDVRRAGTPDGKTPEQCFNTVLGMTTDLRQLERELTRLQRTPWTAPQLEPLQKRLDDLGDNILHLREQMAAA